ncbi:MAG: T9SS type A sorting domain-containing protein [Bacteroidia bacterium]
MKISYNYIRCGFTVILAILSSINISAQIPNWNMESWTTVTKDVPSQWLTYGTTTKISPGQNGSYAVKLQGDQMGGPGAILFGYPNKSNNGFDGGTPFTARPDSLIAYFKYSITAGDSAWVLVQMKKNGVIISSDLYEYTGVYTGDYKRMAFKMHYLSGATPDSMFIGFTSTIPNGNSSNAVSWVIIDNISFTGTTQNIPNPDFENWTTQTNYTPNGWTFDIRPTGNVVDRTTDKYDGNYAMKLQSIFLTGDTLQGYIQTGVNNNNNGYWGPTFPVNSTPNSLKGFYKFFPQNGDTLSIEIGLFKNGVSVGFGNYLSSNSLSTYTPISIPIFYNNTPPTSPDSAIIHIATFAMTGNNNRPRGQSVAFIDNLSFDQFIYAGIPAAVIQKNEILVFPNPAESNLNVRFQLMHKEKVTIRLTDLNGREVMNQTVPNPSEGNNEISLDVNSVSGGLYFLILETGNSVMHSKITIIK